MAVADSPLTLGDALVREGIITPAQLKAALERQRDSSHAIGRVLVDMGFVTEGQRMGVLQKTFKFGLIGLKKVKIDSSILNLIPRVFAEKHRILPVRQEKGSTLIVAMEDPSDLVVLDAVKSQVGMSVKALLATSNELADALRRNYERGAAAQVTDEEEPGGEHGRLYRFLAYTAFPILTFGPVVGFMAMLVFSGSFQNDVSRLWNFDNILFGALGWGLWSILLYEANGLIFKDQMAKKKEEEE